MVAPIATKKKTPADAHADALKIFKDRVEGAIGKDALPKNLEPALLKYAEALDAPGQTGLRAAESLVRSELHNLNNEMGGEKLHILNSGLSAYKTSVSESLGKSIAI